MNYFKIVLDKAENNIYYKDIMNRQARMMSQKSVGKLSKQVRKMVKAHKNMEAKPKRTNAEDLEAWNSRDWELRLVHTSLQSAVMALVLRPWAWKTVRLVRVKAKTQWLAWMNTNEAGLRKVLPETVRLSAGWMLNMEEKRGKVRKVVLSRSKSLLQEQTEMQRVWERGQAQWRWMDKPKK